MSGALAWARCNQPLAQSAAAHGGLVKLRALEPRAMGNVGSSKHQQAGHIKAARGRRVTQLAPMTLRLHGGLEGIPSDILQDLGGRIGTRMTRAELWPLGSPRITHWVIRPNAVGFSLLLVLCVAAVIIRPLALGSAARYLLPTSARPAFLYLLWIVARRIRSRRVIEIMLEHLCCPHCAYDLRTCYPSIPRMVMHFAGLWS